MQFGSSRGRFAGVLGLAVSVLAWAVVGSPGHPAGADEPKLDGLAEEYARDVRPLVQRYCQRCHSTRRTEADVNLESCRTLADVRKHVKTWQKVAEMLDSGQMPPKEERQPEDAERDRLRKWVRTYLTFEARLRSGDPGPVVLRRLSNTEYTWTVRDLTGVAMLQPAREFPVDGAAGEGFMNTGNALVMSPALLTKFLDAGKEIASHAVLLPDGFRFSSGTTRRDWTNEVVADIKKFYGQFADGEGRIPLESYLAALLANRDALSAGSKSLEAVARERRLNRPYLELLWRTFVGNEGSLLLDALRSRWSAAGPTGAGTLAADIARWQQALWRFQNVGHMKAWQEPVSPVTAQQDFRVKLTPAPGQTEVTVYFVATGTGKTNAGDHVVWREPRLLAPGRPSLLLRDVREVTGLLASRRERLFRSAANCLSAAAEASLANRKIDVAAYARRFGVETEALGAWLDYLGIGTGGAVRLEGHFTNQLVKVSGYDFIQGWGSSETPSLVANASDQQVRIPGVMKPHSVALHPSPKLQAAVGWRSPVATSLRVAGKVTHAHPECGNGVQWSLELRRGATRQRLAAGIAQGSKEVPVGPIDKLAVQPGDLVSLLIDPRNGDHACDLTNVELVLTAADGHTWDLAGDVSGDILAHNPHADRQGHPAVWHFYAEPVGGGATGPVIPSGSLLARWQSAESLREKADLAQHVQQLLLSGLPAKDGPDAALYRQLASLGGPLLAGAHVKEISRPAASIATKPPEPDRVRETANRWGLDPAVFGRHPDGSARDAGSLCLQAPSIIEVRLPADLVAGSELITSAVLDPKTAAEGCVQVRVQTSKPTPQAGLEPGLPVLTNESSDARRRVVAAMDGFRAVFPAAICYTRVVPVDEVITLTLFHREDNHLCRLMLDRAQRARLDRLWRDLRFISQDAFGVVDAFAQLMEYATQDSDPRKFEPFRKPIQERARALRQAMVAAEPRQLDTLLEFAERAYRRPLTEAERVELRGLYRSLREQELPHEEAFRLTLARVLVAPAFLYRLEKPGAGSAAQPVSDWELASRLSYFLWSSLPDAELRQEAASGRLHDPDTLAVQARRMLGNARVRRMATDFACQWLHVRDFDGLNEKSERHFPTFAGLRGDMYEESIRFFTDLFQRGGSVLDVLDADYTFLNESLAAHYGIPGVRGPEWRRVDGVKRYSRGGILAQATTLAKQSGASRTSPILRGNWVSEVLLGEKLPRPPKEVPRLPEDETATEGLTVRQLVEKHSSDPKCIVCHQRIDAYGFALERFDAIGRHRERDLGGRPIDVRAKTMDGTELDGLDGLRKYLLTQRRDAFLRQFCRKLLGYALGRGLQLSDEPLLAEMQEHAKASGYRFTGLVELIVRSRQFRDIRGRDVAFED